MGRAIRRETEFILGNIYLKYDRSKVMEYSYVYYLDTLVLMIPPGKLLTSFQKLLRPFEPIVWFSIVFTLSCGFFVIAFLQFRSKLVRDFVIGKNVKRPCLNLIGAIVGLGQPMLPTRNFSRSLLMMFILFCLVIRQVSFDVKCDKYLLKITLGRCIPAHYFSFYSQTTMKKKRKVSKKWLNGITNFT